MNGDEIQKEIFRKMTGGQKLKLAMRLYWSSRRLKAAGLRQQHPDWTEEQVQREATEIFRDVRACLRNGLPAIMPYPFDAKDCETIGHKPLRRAIDERGEVLHER